MTSQNLESGAAKHRQLLAASFHSCVAHRCLMDILIINLPRHAERRAFQTKQLEQLGLAFDWVPATDVRGMDPKLFAQLQNTWERPMRDVEVACYLSHLSAWRIVAERKRPALILEDDAYLSTDVPAILKALEGQSFDLVTLEVRGRKKVVGKQSNPLTAAATLVPLYQDRTGAAGYVLSPSGAQKLLAKASDGKAAIADAFISSHYELDAYQVEPAAIIQIDMCEHYGIPAPIQTTSSIGAVARPPASEGANAFKVRRILSQLRMGGRALSVMHKAQRRLIPVNPNSFA